MNLPRTETHDRWETLPEHDQQVVVEGIARLCELKDRDAIRRCCVLANPVIVRGIQYDRTYTRIAPDSLSVLSVVLEAYAR